MKKFVISDLSSCLQKFNEGRVLGVREVATIPRGLWLTYFSYHEDDIQSWQILVWSKIVQTWKKFMTRLTLYKLYAVPVRVWSTREDMHYPWVISSVPVSHILSTYWWGYAVPVSHILSTREGMQYLWGYAAPVREVSFILHSYKFTHGYCISSRVLMIWLTGTAYPYGYWGCDSRVLRIWLTGTAYPYGYWGYDSRVLMIRLTGNAYPHGYCI